MSLGTLALIGVEEAADALLALLDCRPLGLDALISSFPQSGFGAARVPRD
jgi:hypothetical protein